MLVQGFYHGTLSWWKPTDRRASSSSTAWRIFLLEHLMAHPLLKGFTHIAPDLPGYGKSP